jgi:hypothetical protein
MAVDGTGWLTGTGRRWFALISVAGTLASVGAFAASKFQFWAWLAMAFLFSWVVALFWTAHDEHKARIRAELSDPEMIRRNQLRPMLTAAAQRLDHIATVGLVRVGEASPLRHLETRYMSAHKLVEAALGPDIAYEFQMTHAPERLPGMEGTRANLRAKAVYLRALVDRLDSLPIMGDWQP